MSIPRGHRHRYPAHAGAAGQGEMLQPARLHFDLMDMRLFLRIAEASSVTRGAAVANISVAAASMRIKSLERALSTQLLTRTKRGMTLTAAGRILEKHARGILASVNDLYHDLQEHSGQVAGHIRMFINPT